MVQFVVPLLSLPLPPVISAPGDPILSSGLCRQLSLCVHIHRCTSTHTVHYKSSKIGNFLTKDSLCDLVLSTNFFLTFKGGFHFNALGVNLYLYLLLYLLGILPPPPPLWIDNQWSIFIDSVSH